jgi:hypothetical protein
VGLCVCVSESESPAITQGFVADIVHLFAMAEAHNAPLLASHLSLIICQEWSQLENKADLTPEQLRSLEKLREYYASIIVTERMRFLRRTFHALNDTRQSCSKTERK